MALAGNLRTKLLTHTFVFFGTFQSAGTVAAGAAQALTDGADDLLIFVETYLHTYFSFCIGFTVSITGGAAFGNHVKGSGNACAFPDLRE